MSGYVPNNWNVRKEPEPKRYNGNFDEQAPRPLETQPQKKPECLVGMRFIWDNGELLPPSTPYLLTTDQGSCLQGGLSEHSSFTHTVPQGGYQAQLLANTDVDSAVASARSEMQAALDEILAAERAEAAALRKEQEGRNVLVNYLHTHFAFGKGFFLGAWGLIKSLKEMGDLVSPYNHAWNMLASAWKAKVSPKEGWYASFLRNYSEAQHKELVEALGFDPASVTREQIAEAYETACFIYDDGPSKAILARFAMDYAKAQNVEEIAEFGGGAVFELVLAALLIAFTGGAGLAARGAASLRHAASLKRLGTALQRLSRALKNAKIKLKGRARGRGTGAQTVEVPRPREIEAERVSVPDRAPLSKLQVDEILSTPKGQRPNPVTYLSAEYLAEHAAMFKSGVARVQPSAPSGKIGRTETWVLPKSVADEAISRAGGDVGKLEKLLGLDSGYLGSSPVRVDIPSPTGYRIPTGNEFGANDYWRPGGYTWPGGLPEAVVDAVLPSNYAVTKVF